MKPFLIYILESPSSDDILAGRGEGDSVSRILDLCQIPNKLYTVISKDTLRKAIQLIKADYRDSRTAGVGKIPLVHLSCHGNDGVVGLSNGETIGYKSLLEELRPIGDEFIASDTINPLHISMSSCKGLFAINFDSTESSPFAILIGSEDNVEWTDSLVAYAAFYNSFIYKDLDIKTSMNSMNIAIGQEKLFEIYRANDLVREIKKDQENH